MAFARANPVLYRLMWPADGGELPPAAAASAAALFEGFERLAAQGALRVGVNPAAAARALSAALHGVTDAIAREPGSRGQLAMSALVRDAVITALVAPIPASSGSTDREGNSP